MSTTIGSLIAELGLDDTAYRIGLKQSYNHGLSIVKDLEKQFNDIPKNIKLEISPKIDHKPLKDLNKHFDLKQQHAKSLQSYFDRNPLTPRFDNSELKQSNYRTIGPSSSKLSSNKDEKILEDILSVQKNILNETTKQTAVVNRSTEKIQPPGSNIASGALQGVGQGITEKLVSPFAKGLSDSIENSLSGVFGSSQALGKTIGQDLSKVIELVFSKLSPDIIEEIKNVVPENERLIAGLNTRNRIQTQDRSLQTPAINQATLERRDTLRKFKDIDLERIQNQSALENNFQLQQRGGSIQSALKNRRSLVDDGSNEAADLDKSLTEVANQLMMLADEEIQLISKQERIGKALKEARENIKSAKDVIDQIAPEQLPEVFQTAVNTIAGKNISANIAPKLVVADEKLNQIGAEAQYGVESNTVQVTSEMMQAIEQGQLTLEQMETLYHELQHAVDFDFGSAQGIQARQQNRILGEQVVPTAEEMRAVSPLINQYSPEQRQFELNAEVRGRRNAAKAFEQQQSQLEKQRIYNVAGVGGINYLSKADSSISAVESQLSDLVSMAETVGVSATHGIENLSETLNQTRHNVSKLTAEITNAEKLSSEELKNLQNALGEQFEELYSLQNQMSEVKKDFVAYLKPIIQSRKAIQEIDQNIESDPWETNLPTDETGTSKNVVAKYIDSQVGKVKQTGQNIIDDPWGSASEAANLSGKALKNAIEATQKELFILNQSIKLTSGIMKQGADVMGDIYNSAPVQSFVSGIGNATNAMGAVVGASYQLASGIESVALDMIPMGRTAKSVLQQTVVPAAMFGAGTHMIPGGEMAAGYLMDAASGALGPTGAAVSHSLGAGATEAIGSVIPNVLGLPQALSGAATGAIEIVTTGAVQIIASAGVAIAGGKVIEQGIKSALPGSVKTPPNRMLPGAQPLQLHQASQEKDAILVEVQPTVKKLKAAKQHIKQETTQLNKTLKQANTQATEIVSELGDIDTDSLKTANISKAKEIGAKFQEAYAKFKDLVDEGNTEFASTYAKVITDMAKHAKEDMESLISELAVSGENTSFGSDASNKINAVKGQITRKRNEVNRYLKKQNVSRSDDDDELSAPRLDLDRLTTSKAKQVLSKEDLEQLKELDELLKSAEDAADRFDSAMRRLDKSSKQSFEESNQKLNETVEAFERGDIQASKLGKTANRLGNLFKAVFGVIVGFEIGSFLLDFGKQLAGDSVRAALGLEQMTIQLTRMEGTAGAAQAKISELRAEADRLGVSGTQAIGGYVQIAASTQGTALEGVATDQISLASTQASSGLSLNAEQTDRVNVALSQMASKGKISAEEIRGQLGDVLPGAFQIASRAMGMTTQEFDKLMSTGKVFSEDFLPKFAQQLQAEIPAASDSAQASINRFNSQVDQFQEKIGKPLLSAQSLGLDVLATGLDKLLNVLPLIGTLVLTIGVNAAIAFTKATMAALGFSKATLLGSLSVGGLLKSIMALGPAALNALKAFGALALKFAIMQGVIDVFSIIGKATSDSAKETNDFTKDAIAGMEKYRDAIAAVRDEVTGLSKDLPQNREDLRNTSLLEGTIIGSASRAVLGEENGNSFIRNAENNLVNNAARSSLLGLAFDQGSKLLGGEGMVSYAEKVANDQAIAFNEMMNAVNETLSASYSQLGVDGKGVAELGRLQDVDTELNDLNQQRQAISVSDTEARLKIEQEINQLLEERKGLSAATGALQGNISKQIEFLNTYKKTLEERKNAGAITESDYDRELNLVNSALEDLTTTQERFNNLNKESVNQLQLLSRSLREVMIQLQSDSFKNQISAGQQSVNLAKARLSGATEGQTQFSGALLQRDQLNTQITTNSRAITGLKSNLNSTEYTEALDKVGLTIESTSFEIQAALDRLQDGSLKSTLETVAEFKGNLEGLQIDTLGLEEQMIQAQIDANEQIRNANKEITEYYRNVSNESEVLASQVKEIAAQTEFNEIKNKLNSAMSGLSGSFFDGWIGGFISFLDTLQEIIQARIDADRQRMEAQQQQFSQMQQLTQMQNGLPGSIPGVSGGSGGFASPLAGRSIQELVDYQPTRGQSFTAYRNRRSGPDVHGGVDFDSRVGGGAGAGVQATQGGIAEVIRIGTSSQGDSVQVRVKFVDSQGREIEQQYNHLSGSSVQQALGIGPGGGSVQVQTGQSLGQVGATDNLSSGAHLDYKIKINGTLVDPQQYLAALNNGGGSIRAIGGGNISVSGIASPPSQTNNRTPVTSGGYVPRGGTVRNAERVQSDPQGAQAIVNTAGNLGLDPTQFAALMSWESAGTFNPNVVGGDGNQYKGMIQFSPDNQRQYGTQGQQSIAEQMQAVEAYLLDRGFQPGQHDIRHAYSAVLAGQADERYWNRTDSNGTSVRNAAPKFQQGDHYDRARQFLTDSLGSAQVSQQGGIPIGLNTGQLNQAASGTSANNQLQMDLINQREQLSVNMAQAQADLQIRGLINQGTEQLRSIADQSIQMQQDLQNRVIESLPQGDVRSSVEDIIGRGREGGSETTSVARQLEDSGKELEAARKALADVEANRVMIAEQVSAGLLDESNLAQYDTAIAQLKELIQESEALDTQLRSLQSGALDHEATQMLAELVRQTEDAKAVAGNLDPVTAATQGLRRELEALEGNSQTLSDIFRDSIDDRHTEENVELLVAQFEELNNVKIDALTREIERLERSVQLVQDAAILEFKAEGLAELTRILNRSGQGGQAREINYLQQTDQINNDERQAMLGIDERTDISAETKDQLRQYTTETFANRRENAAYDYEVSNQSANIEANQAVLGSRRDHFGVKQQQADLLGFGGIAALEQEEMNLSLDEQALSFESQLLELEQMRESLGLTNEQFTEMRDNIVAANDLSIDNIKTQFSDLPEIIGAIKQPMADALGSWIDGTKTFNQAFGDMLSSIFSNLVSMMANKAIEGLLGTLLGGGDSGDATDSGGGIGGILGTIFGGLFKDGGKIGFATGGVLHGMDPIKDAMKKEGPGARLIVANTSEWVLNRKHQDILRMYGVDEKVLGFKSGGAIGPSTGASVSVPGSNTNVSVNIPINMTGGDNEDDGNELAKRISGPIKSLITTEIQKMQRPGGQLRRSRP